jgi:hypothetical protein
VAGPSTAPYERFGSVGDQAKRAIHFMPLRAIIRFDDPRASADDAEDPIERALGRRACHL